MKKSGRKVLSVILTAVMVFALLPIISFPIKAKAEWGIDNGLKYEIVGDEVFIRNQDYSDSELVIPAQIEGISKISIPQGAFMGCSNLESVVFDGNVGDIGESAFLKCKKLESVVFNGNVGDIGEHAFSDCEKLESVVINGNVGDIGENAFCYCSSLERVEFNGNVGNIEKNSFHFCSSLKSIKFARDVEAIGGDAFPDCGKLESVVFNGNVGDIGEYAFDHCISLERVEFNGNVGNIGEYAFYLCISLKSIKFAGDVEAIGENAFSGGKIKTVLIPRTTKIEKNSFAPLDSKEVIKYGNIDGYKYVYTGQNLSEEVCVSITGKISPNDEYKILFYKGENEVKEVKNIGDYTAELLLKGYNNPEKYTSLLKTNFTVEKLNICDSTVYVETSPNTLIYNGEDQNAQINKSIKAKIVGSDSVLPSDDYTVMFSNDGGQTFSENLACKNVGSYQAKIVAKGSNCTGEVSGISFTINPIPLTITASDASKDCDGNTLESKGYRIDGLVGNDSIKSINVTGSQTGPGKSENVPSDAVIVNAAGEDVTDCYDITYVKGTLTVTDHVFDQEIATDEHMASPATQNSPANYFKSCLCGENGTETFEAGDPLPTYTITFEANGGIVDIEVIGTNEEYKLDSLPTPTYEGYDFKGWYTNATGGTEITTDTVFGANMTIYAHWEKKEEPKPAQDGNSENPEDPEEPQEPDPEVELPEKDWLDDLRLALRIADELGGAQTVEYNGDFALSYDIMTYLVEHPSITFIYHVKYEDFEYTIIIPAGKAVSSPEIPWYGPLWLLANYGNGNVPAGVKENGTY